MIQLKVVQTIVLELTLAPSKDGGIAYLKGNRESGEAKRLRGPYMALL